MAQKKTKLKRAVSITVNVLTALILVFSACLCIFSLAARSNGRQVKLFGYSFSIVVSESMTPEIKVGELVTVKHCSIEKAKIGDNAMYIVQSGELKGQRIIHKIEIKDVDENGKTFIRTRGVKEHAPLDEPVYAENFVGIGVAHSAFMGSVVVFFSQPVNWLYLLVFCAGVLLGVRQIRKLVQLSKPDAAENEGAEATPDGAADGEDKSEK